jgi:hypothetical protein
VDVFVELAKRGRVGGKVQGPHRELTHFPLSFIPVLAIVYYYFDPVWFWLFSFGIFFHFLHDSIGMGWGIKWFWPFSRRSYKLFSEKDGRLFSKNFVASWSPEELKPAIEKYGDDDWFRNFYIKLHPIAILELLVFIVSIVVLLYYIV